MMPHRHTHTANATTMTGNDLSSHDDDDDDDDDRASRRGSAYDTCVDCARRDCLNGTPGRDRRSAIRP